MDFIHESDRVYMKDSSGKMIAEVTFPQIGSTVQINHTFVDSLLRGQGIAGKLMLEVAKKLRNENRKAIPTCSYAIKWFEENVEFEDVIQK